MGGTLSDFHRTEEEKECSPLFLPICKVGKKSGGVHCFSPSIRWGKRVGGTVFFPICKVEKECKGYTLFLHLITMVVWRLCSFVSSYIHGPRANN